jgi:hypothetical protein
MNENDLRDCFAMFASVGLLMRGDNGTAVPERSYEMADRMLEVRKWKEFEQESGIAAFKPKRRTAKKVSDVD